MATADSQARLQFLKHSADILKVQSPSTAAHLMSVHNHALREGFNSIPPSLQRTSCGACGSFRVFEEPSNSSTTPTDSNLHRRSHKPTAKEGSIYECPRCHRRTFPAVRKQKPLRKGQPSASTAKPPTTQPLPQTQNDSTPKAQPEVSSTPDPKSTTSGNTSSKKRAKARKQQGLQALLAAGKDTSKTSSSTSLDLLDFLQP
ncbi:hypothetical protein FQN54_006733 [Arachnomyces sp. PD_36]|nr:hypothetical protein FQN54_006733 [Arachnomyces sp. PD_36]